MRAYRKNELAHLYNPDMTYACALRTLRAWIAHHKVLASKLAQSGYLPAQHKFTPKQVELLFTYLGMP